MYIACLCVYVYLFLSVPKAFCGHQMKLLLAFPLFVRLFVCLSFLFYAFSLNLNMPTHKRHKRHIMCVRVLKINELFKILVQLLFGIIYFNAYLFICLLLFAIPSPFVSGVSAEVAWKVDHKIIFLIFIVVHICPLCYYALYCYSMICYCCCCYYYFKYYC